MRCLVLQCRALCLVWCLASISGQSLAQSPGTEIYTCIDASGHKITSDRKIASCNDREQKVLNPSGTVRRVEGPSLTAQEMARNEARAKARQLEQAHRNEEKKRDRALLNRYPNEATHKKEREEAVAQIDLVKQAANLRINQLKAEQAKLEDEMAFYAGNPQRAPMRLRLQLDAVNNTLEGQRRFIADKDVELERINTRFDEEFQRLRLLWQLNDASDRR